MSTYSALSIYSIPVYWIVALSPHVYAVEVIKNANNRYWNINNPRALLTATNYQKSIPAEVYARFERAEAAHCNMLENAPLFIGAVIVGNMAGLEHGFLNTAIGIYLALRAVYVLLYINTTRHYPAFARSFAWLFSVITLVTVYVKAGNKLR